jgi:hypothetical protein
MHIGLMSMSGAALFWLPIQWPNIPSTIDLSAIAKRETSKKVAECLDVIRRAVAKVKDQAYLTTYRPTFEGDYAGSIAGWGDIDSISYCIAEVAYVHDSGKPCPLTRFTVAYKADADGRRRCFNMAFNPPTLEVETVKDNRHSSELHCSWDSNWKIDDRYHLLNLSDVNSDVICEPNWLRFGHIRKDQEKSGEVKLTSRSGANVEVADIDVKGQSIKWKVVSGARKGEATVQFTVHCTDEMARGIGYGYDAVIRFKNPKQLPVTINWSCLIIRNEPSSTSGAKH